MKLRIFILLTCSVIFCSFDNSTRINQYKKAISNYRGGKYKYSKQTKEIIILFEKTLQKCERRLQGPQDRISIAYLKKEFYASLDHSPLSKTAKNAAKKSFEKAFPSKNRKKNTGIAYGNCTYFQLKGRKEVKKLYQKLSLKRNSTGFHYEIATGGVANIGHQIFKSNPQASIGVLVATNSGLPGGRLSNTMGNITEEDLALATQEESVWANAILTECGTDRKKQVQMHNRSIGGRWGMLKKNVAFKKIHANADELKKINFVTTDRISDYNGVFVVRRLSLSAIQRKGKNFHLLSRSKYPVIFVFADSVNAGNMDSPKETMKRTRNRKAADDYIFFKKCIKKKLRSSLDAMAKNGVTHALIAKLSTGIYAGQHKNKIQRDFPLILKEVLNEEVGPHKEKRGQYFIDIIISTLFPK